MTNLRLAYQTLEFGKTDIHLCTLRNNQEFYDPDGTAERLGISSASWPLFGVVWPSGLVLAHHMHTQDTSGRRILEVGCGTAISSLLLNKRNDDITATDYHPETEVFLKRNAELNGDDEIAYVMTDWADTNQELGKFDLIIGSDLLYEDEHVGLLTDFLERHANKHCEIILVDPGRGRKTKLSKKLIALGYEAKLVSPAHTDYLEKTFKGHILSFKRSA